MRIRLAEEEQGHRKRRRRSRTFDRTVALPQAPARRSDRRPNQPPDPVQVDTKRRAGRNSQPAEHSRPRRRRAAARTVSTDQAQPAVTRVRTWPRRLLALLLMALIVAAGAWASTDARFFVYEGHIIGARYLAAESIYQVAGVHEQNIFWIDPGAVVQRVAQMNGIKAARVRCDLPALVRIEVEERQPLILWRAQAQNRDWWLDDEGVVLPYHGDTRSPQTIFVVDYSPRQLAVGQKVEPESIVESVIQLANALPETDVFFYENDRGLSFTQKVDGASWPVLVGSSDDLARKIQVMQSLMTYLKANGVRPQYIDVRWAAHPVYGRAAGGGQ